MRFLKPSEIVFAEDKIEKEFNELREVQILAVILEWFNHKDYERKFHY